MIDDSNTFTIRRIFQAPRELVFDAWTKPEHLEKWWKCDPAWSTSQVTVDFRVGGQWRMGMVNPENQQEYVCFGQFCEIDSPRRVVYTWQWEPPGMEHETLVTVEFNEQENATELVLYHSNFPAADIAKDHHKGWSGALAAAQQYVSDLSAN